MSSDPVTVAPGDPVADAWAILAREGIRHLPVVEDGKLAGIVSDRDLLKITGGDGKRGADTPVRDVMSASPKTCEPDDTLVTASLELGTGGIGCLPVLGRKGELTAILTETDVLRAYLEAVREERVSLEDPPVSKHMTAVPESVTPETSVADALALVAKRGFRHLPVLNGNELVGFLSHRDLCRELGRGEQSHPVSEAMATRVISVSPTDSLTLAAELMLENKISAVPVVEYADLVGILSVTDMVDHCLVTLGEG